MAPPAGIDVTGRSHARPGEVPTAGAPAADRVG